MVFATDSRKRKVDHGPKFTHSMPRPRGVGAAPAAPAAPTSTAQPATPEGKTRRKSSGSVSMQSRTQSVQRSMVTTARPLEFDDASAARQVDRTEWGSKI